MKRSTALVYAALLSLAAGAQAQAAGDAKRGADTFAEECGDCHSAVAGKNKKGPSLNGVVGRKAGSAAGYAKYSAGMTQVGFAWTAEKIEEYIAHPRKVVPTGKMKYDGLDDPAARADVIAYLGTLK